MTLGLTLPKQSAVACDLWAFLERLLVVSAPHFERLLVFTGPAAARGRAAPRDSGTAPGHVSPLHTRLF